MLQILIVLFITAHWFACTIAMTATMHHDPQLTWLGQDKYALCAIQAHLTGAATGSPAAAGGGTMAGAGTGKQEAPPSAAANGNWDTGLVGCDQLSLGSFYLAAFSWSTMVSS